MKGVNRKELRDMGLSQCPNCKGWGVPGSICPTCRTHIISIPEKVGVSRRHEDTKHIN